MSAGPRGTLAKPKTTENKSKDLVLNLRCILLSVANFALCLTSALPPLVVVLHQLMINTPRDASRCKLPNLRLLVSQKLSCNEVPLLLGSWPLFRSQGTQGGNRYEWLHRLETHQRKKTPAHISYVYLIQHVSSQHGLIIHNKE